LQDIMRFFRLKRDKTRLKIKYMTMEEVLKLKDYIKNGDFKALVLMTIASAGRPCEVIKVKYGENVYKNKNGKWVIHLPEVKGVSYQKFPIELQMFDDELNLISTS